jgi:hypothetical protein
MDIARRSSGFGAGAAQPAMIWLLAPLLGWGWTDARAACTQSSAVGDWCASWSCGPCDEGEGDCDPGQCASGLTCVEEGATDRCRPVVDTCATPGAMDFCATSRCGPCGDGEGDCDPGQCAAGLECVEEGAVDHCRADTCATPGAMDFCATSRCGPCGDGEGDCDPGQCGGGLECVEEGAVDHCRPAESSGGASNLQVEVAGVWRGVCCSGSRLELSEAECSWTESGRVLTDQTGWRQFDCHEGSPTDCDCDGSGEHMHGVNGDLNSSLSLPNGGPVYPDYQEGTCVVVKSSGELATAWTSGACPRFRLQ